VGQQIIKTGSGSSGEFQSTMNDQMQTKPRHEAGVTGDAVLFCYSFLLMEQKLTENHGHSRRISQRFTPKRSVLMKNLAHV
jgi:hypothetical protein